MGVHPRLTDGSPHPATLTQPLLTRPTYVLKWKDILPQHLKHTSLVGDCGSFILKSKLLGAVSKRIGLL